MLLRARRAVAILALAALAIALSSACRKEPPRRTPEEVAYEFRDVMPYPGVTEGDEAEHLAPLLPAYLVYIEGNDFPRAANEFEKVSKAHPAMAEARLLQGIAQVLAERPGLAIAPLESVVKEAPRSSSAHWWLAKALLMTQRRDEAMPHLREVVSLGNDYATEASKVLAAAEPAGA